MINNELTTIRARIKKLESELYRLLETQGNRERINEIVDELNWYNEQYIERY